MTRDVQEQVIKAYFDHDAGKYLDERYPERARTCDQHSYHVRKRIVLGMLEGAVDRPGRLLDIGCGPGSYTRDLLDRGWEVDGIDISREMTRQAARRVAVHPRSGHVRFLTGAATALPFPDEAFDAVLCIGVVSYVEQLERALGEIFRVVRRGGAVIFQISNRLAPIELEYRVRRWREARSSGRSGGEDALRESITLRAYRPAAFESSCRAVGFEPRGGRFYDFRLPGVGVLSPLLALALGRLLEPLGRARRLGHIGAGYVVEMRRPER